MLCQQYSQVKSALGSSTHLTMSHLGQSERYFNLVDYLRSVGRPEPQYQQLHIHIGQNDMKKQTHPDQVSDGMCSLMHDRASSGRAIVDGRANGVRCALSLANQLLAV